MEGRFARRRQRILQPAPAIDWFSIAYLPKNIAPQVTAIAMQDPGVRVQGFPSPPQVSGPQTSAQLRMPQPPPSASSSNSGFTVTTISNLGTRPARRTSIRFRRARRKKDINPFCGPPTIANDDQLEFAIYFRGENETSWKLLKDKLDTKFYSWDTTSMPDGAYYLKIVASDAPSNPERRGTFFRARIRPLRCGQHAAIDRAAHGGARQRRRARAIPGQRSRQLHCARAIQRGCGRLDAGLSSGGLERCSPRELRFSVAKTFAGRAHRHGSRVRPV